MLKPWMNFFDYTSFAKFRYLFIVRWRYIFYVCQSVYCVPRCLKLFSKSYKLHLWYLGSTITSCSVLGCLGQKVIRVFMWRPCATNEGLPATCFFALHMQCIIKICAVKLIKFILSVCILGGFHAPKSVCFRGCAPATGLPSAFDLVPQLQLLDPPMIRSTSEKKLLHNSNKYAYVSRKAFP